jgi:hypothetical protein
MCLWYSSIASLFGSPGGLLCICDRLAMLN